MSKELRRDRHTVSLLSDHMMFAPKYRGKILAGDVAMVAKGIICKICKDMGIETQDQYHAKNAMYRPRYICTGFVTVLGARFHASIFADN